MASPTPSSETEPHTTETSRRRQTVGRAGLIGAATMTSRVLGMVREHIFARLFGASGGIFSDAFMIAYRIPNLLRDLFAEGALSSAFVPTFADYKENHGEAEAFRLAQIVFTALFALVGGITIAAIIFAPVIVDVLAPGFSGFAAKRDLTISLTRWMMPFLLLVSWAAVARGVLNTYHQYLIPAISPALFNLVAVASGVGMWAAGLPAQTAVYGWALATLVGGAITFFVQVPDLYRLGLRFRLVLSMAHAGFRRIMMLMAPATIGLAAVQANVIVASVIASYLEQGTVSWLNYAFRLAYLPIGVIGVAVATVSTVNLSQHAARGDLGALKSDAVSALRFVAFLTVPAGLGLIVLDIPIVRIVYEYDRFDPVDTIYTAGAVTCYGWALFFYSGVKVLAPAFYALNRLWVPMVASVTAMLLNLVWSLSTYQTLGYRTLAVGTALAATINFTILALVLREHLRDVRSGEVVIGRGFGFGLKMITALIPMAAASWFLNRWIEGFLGVETVAARAAGVLLPVLASVVIFLGLTRLMHIPEAHDLLAVLRRRRR